MTTSHVPAGFCPDCGHAIDPGRCPECGVDCPDPSPRPPWRPWPVLVKAAAVAAVPPALVIVMVIVAFTAGRSARPFLQVAIPTWFGVAALMFIGLTAYAVVLFVRERRHARPGWGFGAWRTGPSARGGSGEVATRRKRIGGRLRLAVILLLLPAFALAGIVFGWGVMFGVFAD